MLSRVRATVVVARTPVSAVASTRVVAAQTVCDESCLRRAMDA